MGGLSDADADRNYSLMLMASVPDNAVLSIRTRHVLLLCHAILLMQYEVSINGKLSTSTAIVIA